MSFILFVPDRALSHFTCPLLLRRLCLGARAFAFMYLCHFWVQIHASKLLPYDLNTTCWLAAFLLHSRDDTFSSPQCTCSFCNREAVPSLEMRHSCFAGTHLYARLCLCRVASCQALEASLRGTVQDVVLDFDSLLVMNHDLNVMLTLLATFVDCFMGTIYGGHKFASML